MSTKIKMPNFLVVGAPKCGTTSLYEYFKQHPEIFVHPSIKETNFFVEPKDVLGNGPRFYGKASYGNSLERYQKLFEGVSVEHKAVGEVCPTYLPFYRQAIPNILHHLGEEIRILIVLRNPADRAFSHYMHNVRDTDETLSFEDALINESARINAGLWNSFYLTRLGFYSAQVEAYFNAFSNVKVILYDDLRSDVALSKIYQFLGVRGDFKADTRKHFNKSGRPINGYFQSILMSNGVISRYSRRFLPTYIKQHFSRIRENIIDKNIRKEEMKEETRAWLNSIFSADIERLSHLINRDLSHWC